MKINPTRLSIKFHNMSSSGFNNSKVYTYYKCYRKPRYFDIIKPLGKTLFSSCSVKDQYMVSFMKMN